MLAGNEQAVFRITRPLGHRYVSGANRWNCERVLLSALVYARIVVYISNLLPSSVARARGCNGKRIRGEGFCSGRRDEPERLDATMVAFLVAGQFLTVLYYPYFRINLSLTVAWHAVCRRVRRLRSQRANEHDFERSIILTRNIKFVDRPVASKLGPAFDEA